MYVKKKNYVCDVSLLCRRCRKPRLYCNAIYRFKSSTNMWRIYRFKSSTNMWRIYRFTSSTNMWRIYRFTSSTNMWRTNYTAYGFVLRKCCYLVGCIREYQTKDLNPVFIQYWLLLYHIMDITRFFGAMILSFVCMWIKWLQRPAQFSLM